MKGFGKFFSEKLGIIQEKVSDSVGKLNDSISIVFNAKKLELATDLVNITAKVNEKVTSLQNKPAGEKKDQPPPNFDLNITKCMLFQD